MKKESKGPGQDFLEFTDLMVPGLIKFLYVLGVVVILVAPFVAVYMEGSGTTLPYAVLFVVGANIAWRVICECVIVVFRIYECLYASQTSLETLAAIAQGGGTLQAAAPAPRRVAPVTNAPSHKCWECGLVNFRDAPACKKCGAPLKGIRAGAPAGI